jgi:hypothetical protein
LRRRRDGKGEFALAAVIYAKALQEETAESGSRTTSRGVKDEKSLETGAIVSQLADAIEDEINNLLAGGVMTTGVVVGGVFLPVDNLLGVVELLVRTRADFVTDGGFEIYVDSAGDVLAPVSLAEEGVEGVVGLTGRL